MGANSNISWTDHTFNPWEGCTKVSPGCLNCYAETRNARFGGGVAPNWGAGKPRRRTSVENWKQPVRWNSKARDRFYQNFSDQELHGEKSPLPEARRPRVFCSSLADWLDDEVPIEWLADLLKLIRDTPYLDWQLLTKRPQKWDLRLKAARDWHFESGDRNVCDWITAWRLDAKAPGNIWFGVSAEDQKRFDERAGFLTAIPAKKTFVSFEPLLEPISILKSGQVSHDPPETDVWMPHRIDWGIIGGESGHGSRPCCMDWIAMLAAQLQIGEAAVFVKQMGSRSFTFIQPPDEVPHFKSLNMQVPPQWEYHLHFKDSKGGDPAEWPTAFQLQNFPV
jgi:protein gp37